jgi:hypothetical protein
MALMAINARMANTLFPDDLSSHHLRDSKTAATDVWYFLWALDSKERPEKMPDNQPRLMAKPNCKYVACRLCG